MLPSHENASKLLNASTSKTVLMNTKHDIKRNDDDDDDKSRHSLLDRRYKKNDFPVAVETSEAFENDEFRRPTSLRLNLAADINTNGPEDISEVDGRKRDVPQRRLTIGFDNITYSNRKKLPWSKGNLAHISCYQQCMK